MLATNGWHILIVEDDPIIGMMLQDMLRELNCIPLGPAGSVKAALTLLDATPSLHGALLDCNLGRERVWPVADRLVAQELPFLLSTGYGQSVIEARFARVPVLAKPYSLQKLRQTLLPLLKPRGS